MKGNVTKRGEKSWRLKFDIGRDPTTGKRLIEYRTVQGTKKEAEAELARLLHEVNTEAFVKATKLTLAEYLRQWIADAEAIAISPKTAERYKGLIDSQIIPHLGKLQLQKLRPADVKSWHAKLLKSGRVDGGALSARTVGHAHRVLHKALKEAVNLEVIRRNPAAVVDPPTVKTEEIETLSADQVGEVLAKLRAESLFPFVMLALGTGMRRGELLALRWSDVDLTKRRVRVERSLEETRTVKMPDGSKEGGLRFKEPKTENGRRTITLPANVVEALKDHRRGQLETRMKLGQGRPADDALVFSNPVTGEPRLPLSVTKEWARLVKKHDLPRVTLHALRHSHASALIAAGLDVVTISRRLGHGSPTVTLDVYGHLFDNTDDRAADVMNAALSKGGPE